MIHTRNNQLVDNFLSVVHDYLNAVVINKLELAVIHESFIFF